MASTPVSKKLSYGFLLTNKTDRLRPGVSEITAKVHRGNIMRKTARVDHPNWCAWPMHSEFQRPPARERETFVERLQRLVSGDIRQRSLEPACHAV